MRDLNVLSFETDWCKQDDAPQHVHHQDYCTFFFCVLDNFGLHVVTSSGITLYILQGGGLTLTFYHKCLFQVLHVRHTEPLSVLAAVVSVVSQGQRSDVECQQRWQQMKNPELVKGPWTQEEDERVNTHTGL